ncbi:Protein-tyrosine phosphatase [Popillia japonica]|uniref:Protein-tyrosine phosphatase n=1 Tax=Popillia japonica TaxID=7064 RepID=A0AAW1LBB7_POPJA
MTTISSGVESRKSGSRPKHRSRSSPRANDRVEKKKHISAANSLVSVPNTIKLSMLNSGLLSSNENNSLTTTIEDKPIDLKDFIKFCDQKRKFPVLYKLEFQLAVKVETHSSKQGFKKANIEKNQNQKLVPYDYNRVVLEKHEGEMDTDYINASYVDSLLKPNAYIVTQGPSEETVTDFWRMIWQEKASCIVMLTKTFDFIKVMCVQYWPANMELEEIYGGITIKVTQEEELANFRIRTFKLHRTELDVSDRSSLPPCSIHPFWGCIYLHLLDLGANRKNLDYSIPSADLNLHHFNEANTNKIPEVKANPP